jgi:RNA polymerase sigma-70 factor (ECF subfamily)
VTNRFAVTNNVPEDDGSRSGNESARLRSGDAAAWEELYGRMYPAMLAYANRRLPTLDEARDAVGEAMVRAVASVGRLQHRDTGPEGWVFGILRHVVIDAQRRGYRRRDCIRPAPVTVESSSEDYAQTVESEDEHVALRIAFTKLTDRERDLLELRVVAGLHSEEVASLLGMRPGAVRMAQARALARLRHFMAIDPVTIRS